MAQQAPQPGGAEEVGVAPNQLLSILRILQFGFAEIEQPEWRQYTLQFNFAELERRGANLSLFNSPFRKLPPSR
ncbi:MAG: hypothetical protein K0R75_75 [Paenibacillaceae bacterium]|jgi:hypothetical protein|nr:hypothetical protein [Paenibacillaceae bacterium]